jgi:hypothetical protein
LIAQDRPLFSENHKPRRDLRESINMLPTALLSELDATTSQLEKARAEVFALHGKIAEAERRVQDAQFAAQGMAKQTSGLSRRHQLRPQQAWRFDPKADHATVADKHCSRNQLCEIRLLAHPRAGTARERNIREVPLSSAWIYFRQDQEQSTSGSIGLATVDPQDQRQRLSPKLCPPGALGLFLSRWLIRRMPRAKQKGRRQYAVRPSGLKISSRWKAL